MSATVHPLTDGPTRPGHRPHLQVAGTSPAIDLVRAERAVAELLAALGQDPTAEPLLDTPRRVAASYAELLTPASFTLTTFPNDEGYDQLVLARAIPFASLCQHHLLPFTGLAHVGCLPAERILGLSKLARVVELFARRLQVQERLTRSPTGSRPTWSPRASGCCWRPSTCACRCAACGQPAPAPSPPPCTACSEPTPARARSSSPSPGSAGEGPHRSAAVK